MNEMLSAFATLSRPLFEEMRGQADGFRHLFDVPRILYAMNLVETRTLPTSPPGDLETTGQVGIARRFLRNSATEIPSPGSAGDPSGGMQTVIDALESRRLVADLNNVKGQLRAIATAGEWTDPRGGVLRASAGLVKMLAGLTSNNSTMTLMSMFRFGGGAHGAKQADGSGLGQALDIVAYQGFEINLKTPANAGRCISGVAAVIAHLPAGKYTLGLPRPGGGDKIDPDNDVFLPVTDLKQVVRSPGGSFARDLALVLEPAQSALRAAAQGNNPAQIEFMFPDAVDHLHIKCTS